MASPSSVPRHTQIYTQLVRRLSLLAPGELFPTVAALMTEFGVSQVTITEAIRRLHTRGFIRRPVGKKRYVVTGQAQQRRAMVAVVRPIGPSAAHEVLLAALMREFAGRRWSFQASHYAAWTDLDWVRLKQEHDGIISVGQAPERAAMIKCPGGDDYRWVALTEHAEEADGGFGVTGDEIALGRLAVEALRQLGHRRIAVLRNEPSNPASARRWRGWREAMTEAGEPDPGELEIDGAVGPDEDPVEGARVRLGDWLDERGPAFTAIFATTWTGAQAVLRVMQDRALPLPTTCSLLAPGGLWSIGAQLVPPLSTLDHDAEAWARAACDLLAAQLEGPAVEPRWISLPPELHLRRTTAPLRIDHSTTE